MSKMTSVFGIINDRNNLETAVDQLRHFGFSSEDISVLYADGGEGKDFAHEKHTKAPEGAVTGFGTGAVLGGALGWLVGVGTLAIPGVGPFIAAGPILATLAGIGVGGTVGGVSGALIGMGMPEFEAKRYEDHLKRGRILLSVQAATNDHIKKAKEILKECGAEDVSSTSTSKAPKEGKSSTIKTTHRSRDFFEDSSTYDDYRSDHH